MFKDNRFSASADSSDDFDQIIIVKASDFGKILFSDDHPYYLQTIYIENNIKLFRNSQYYFELRKKSKLFSIGLNSSKLSGNVRFAIYTHLDQEMLQATAEDPADVFKKVDAAARKKQKLASKVLWFPKTGG